MNKMPHSSILRNDYKDKEVIFIYLCNRSTPERWKATIAEKKIEGEHYYLSDDQYNVLKYKFQIQGIPRYILVDKEGGIIDENAPEPSSEEIRSVLEKLLNELNSS